MGLLNRAADALLARLVPSDAAKAAACVSCPGVGGCSVSVQYKTDSVACKTYARCSYSSVGRGFAYRLSQRRHSLRR